MKRRIIKALVFLILMSLPYIFYGQIDINSFSTVINYDKASSWFEVKEINLYGAGNILGLVTGNDSPEDSTSPTGSVGLNFATSNLTCDLFFSYNGKQEIELNTLGDFGNTLMNPNLGGQSFTFKARARLSKPTYKLKFGLSSSVSVADNIYVIDENKIDSSPFVFRIGGYISPFNFSPDGNHVNLLLDVHYTHRSILGDFNNEEQTIEGKNIFDQKYNGLDISINAILNNVKLFVQFSLNKKDRDFLIPGFSGTQVLFGLEVSGNFIKIK